MSFRLNPDALQSLKNRLRYTGSPTHLFYNQNGFHLDNLKLKGVRSIQYKKGLLRLELEVLESNIMGDLDDAFEGLDFDGDLGDFLDDEPAETPAPKTTRGRAKGKAKEAPPKEESTFEVEEAAPVEKSTPAKGKVTAVEDLYSLCVDVPKNKLGELYKFIGGLF